MTLKKLQDYFLMSHYFYLTISARFDASNSYSCLTTVPIQK